MGRGGGVEVWRCVGMYIGVKDTFTAAMLLMGYTMRCEVCSVLVCRWVCRCVVCMPQGVKDTITATMLQMGYTMRCVVCLCVSVCTCVGV